MWNGPLEKLDTYRYRIPSSYRSDMKQEGMLFTSEAMKQQLLTDEACEQVANVATLPGLAGPSMAMPDVHWGYGFPIGGVAATLFDAGGVISPGGVGFDINCGVRLLSTDLKEEDVRPHLKGLVEAMFGNVPSGVGSKARITVTQGQLEQVLTMGARWAVEEGYGRDRDLERTEEKGSIEGADPDVLTDKAKRRGRPQIGSLGAGNHFLEIQKVQEIFDEKAARAMGITGEGQVTIMIHTGSRGLGYQVCQDQVRSLESLYRKDDNSFVSDEFGIRLPDRQLVAAPLNSKQAESYLSAMKCAANYAWTNRQLITHWVRDSFADVLNDPDISGRIDMVYDIAHNMAKVEEHLIDGKRRKVCVHRKGATRAFGPEEAGIPSDLTDIGQPVLIPGDMGTSSYLLVGTKKAMELTFGSTCHGAGRVLSRTKARKKFPAETVVKDLAGKGIIVKAASKKVVSEESPDAYKDIGSVIDVAHGAGISRKVARMVPLGVVKG